MHRLLASLTALALLPACGLVTPKAPAPKPWGPARALHNDLSRIVTTRGRVGWDVDSAEVERASTGAMGSLCRTEELVRYDLLAWYDETIAAEGGPVEDAYERAGRKLEKVRALLHLTRIRMVLERSMERARAGDCPFWVAVDPGFNGVHSDANRFLLFGESNGGISFSPEPNGTTTFAGGGGGRLFMGYGLGPKLTLAIGAEIGGQGQFRASEKEEGRRDVVPRYFGGVPFFARINVGTFAFGLEGAALWQFDEANVRLRPGMRVALTGGTSAVRVRGVMPYIAVGAAMSVFPERDGPTEVWFTAVYRVGFDFDPSLF